MKKIEPLEIDSYLLNSELATIWPKINEIIDVVNELISERDNLKMGGLDLSAIKEYLRYVEIYGWGMIDSKTGKSIKPEEFYKEPKAECKHVYRKLTITDVGFHKWIECKFCSECGKKLV